MLILSIVAFVAIIVLVHELARHTIPLILIFARRAPATLAESQIWVRSQIIWSPLAKGYPAVFEFIQDRIDPRRTTGLPLTLMIAAALYLAALFSGLTEEVLEAEGVLHVDNIVNAAFRPWRVEPLISVFLWITALGSSPSVVSAVIIATGFLWSQRRYHMIMPLWFTCLGAVSTTSIGKFLIGRHRPESPLDVAAPFSSFPSGHATAALAVYGFLAFAIARGLPNMRERFEIAYWTAVLVLLVGLSRIFLGVHYLSDVAGGFLVGGFWLLIGFTLAEWTKPAAPPTQPHSNGPDNFSHSAGVRN
jgi:undecaprenyl-diphosphatase